MQVSSDTWNPCLYCAVWIQGKVQILIKWAQDTYTHIRLMALFSGTTQVSGYQKGKTNLDFTEAWDSEWQWHQLGYMQVCTSLQTDNHASNSLLSTALGYVIIGIIQFLHSASSEHKITFDCVQKVEQKINSQQFTQPKFKYYEPKFDHACVCRLTNYITTNYQY